MSNVSQLPIILHFFSAILYNVIILQKIISVHCNKSGSKRRDFDEMSSEEAANELGKLVDMMDKDKDGYVSRDELVNWVILSFR